MNLAVWELYFEPLSNERTQNLCDQPFSCDPFAIYDKKNKFHIGQVSSPFQVHLNLTTQRFSLRVIPLEISTPKAFYTISTRGPQDKIVKLKL